MADQDGGAELKRRRCIELQPEVTLLGAAGSSAGCRAAVVRDAESPASSGREGLDLGQKSICEHGKGDKVRPTWDSGAHMS
jgi:hypothetical protein